MATEKPKTPNPFDPEALLEAQRRSIAAFTDAGQIVADGMRTYAERQVAMVQEAMSNLWSELERSAQKPQSMTAPTEHFERMRGAFEKVLSQVQELGNLLLKVQSEAMSVLNDCAAKNLESLGAASPDLVALQKKAAGAFEAAMRQTGSVVDEMKRRMASLEEETKRTAEEATSAARGRRSSTSKDA